MLVRALGTVVLAGAGGPHPSPTGIQLRLAATLIARRNHVVEVDALMEAVWWDRSSSPSRNTLQVHIGLLRKQIASPGESGGRLSGSREGYCLHLQDGECDIDAFDMLVAAGTVLGGDDERSTTLLERALLLWRDEPFAGVDGIDLVEQERTRLQRGRLGAVERLGSLLVAQNRPDAALSLVEPLAAQEPYAEGLVEVRMKALYALRRVEAASKLYRRFSSLVAEDLGLEPGRRLQDLHSDVLRGAPAEHRNSAGRQLGGQPGTEPLVGRDEQIAEMAALLRGATTRAICVVGPGGVGKTRVAIAVADTVRGDYDQVAVVFLADVRTADLAIIDVVAAIQLDPTHLRTPARFTEAVAGRRILLLLDNTEHLPELELWVAEVIGLSPSVDVITTGRVAWGAPSVRPWVLPPLAVPSTWTTQSPALALLLNGAGVPEPEDADERQALVEICARCDGLPVALELAASRLRFMTARSLAESLQASLDVLDVRPRHAPNRHGSVQHLFDWTWHLLGRGAAQLLGELSVFAGGAAVADIQLVCGSQTTVLNDLDELIRHSLVSVVEMPSGRRLTMLTTVRRCAANHLDEELRRSIELRHAEHYLRRAAALRPKPSAAVPADHIAWLRAEHGNLRTALRFACASVKLNALAVNALIGAWGLWFSAGNITEGISWVAEIRATGEVLDDLADAELGMLDGALLFYGAQLDAALERLEPAAEVFAKDGRHDWAARAFEAIVSIKLFQGDPSVDDVVARGVRHAEQSGDHLIVGRAHYQAAVVAITREHNEEARAELTEYLHAAQRADSDRDVAVAAAQLALLDAIDGRLSAAREHVELAARVASRAHSGPDLALAEEADAVVAVFAGAHRRAEQLFRKALRTATASGHRNRVDRILLGLAAALAPTSPVDTVRLAAAADTEVVRNGGTAVWPAQRRVCADAIDVACRALSSSQQSRARAEGRAMTRDDIAAEGLGD